MTSHYDPPSWAGKPPVGLHLDVSKDGKLIQKLMIDEKKCYLFGRNPQLNDFCIDHASCSRVHSALIYHKHLNRSFLVDLASTHGTYIGHIRLEAQKPTQLTVDSVFHFGASTRQYTLRERPQHPANVLDAANDKIGQKEGAGGLLGLPESETELDNLTEFNTAHNKRVAVLSREDQVAESNNKRVRRSASASVNKANVKFSESDEVINPEDVDPSVGRFRNLVQTAVIPTKRQKQDTGQGTSPAGGAGPGRLYQKLVPRGGDLYGDLDVVTTGVAASPEPLVSPGGTLHRPLAPHPHHHPALVASSNLTSLGVPLPNPAPDVEPSLPSVPAQPSHVIDSAVSVAAQEGGGPNEPRKKKYAKEAWPGKRPTPALLV